MSTKLIALDPGHYANTPGKRSPDGSLLEYEFNQDVAERAEKKILATSQANVLVTKRINDTYDDNAGLGVRTRLINDRSADVAISIHSNAHINDWTTARGFEVYAYPGSASGAQLSAICLKHYQQKLQSQFGVPNRGMKTANFALVRDTNCPAILIEFEFYTNREGCELLKRNDFRDACADVVVATAFEYLGLSVPVSTQPVLNIGSDMHMGAQGPSVVELQNNLIALGYLSSGSNDGDFGPITKAAVVKFQLDNGLIADGIVGPLTLGKIKERIDVLNAIDYEKELCRIKVDGISQIALTGVSKCEAYARTNFIGHIIIQCKKDDVVVKEFDIAPAPVPQPEPQPSVQEPIFKVTHSILGEPEVSAVQMAQFLLKKNPNPKIPVSALELAWMYIIEGQLEGVRGDLAFAQTLHETGYFAFNGDAKPEWNNFAGIGVTGAKIIDGIVDERVFKAGIVAIFNKEGKSVGVKFDTPLLGVRAQIQHLKAYATAEVLNHDCVDPRYSLVSPKGKAPTLEELGGKWASPGFTRGEYPDFETAAKNDATYGQRIYKLLEQMKLEEVELPKPVEPEVPAPVEEQPKTEKPIEVNPEELLKDEKVVDSLLTLIFKVLKDFIMSLLGKNK